MSVGAMLLAHVVLELAKTPGESDLLRRCEPLVAKEDHLVLEKGVRDRAKRVLIQVPRQVDARDFRAEMLADFPDGEHGSELAAGEARRAALEDRRLPLGHVVRAFERAAQGV